MLMRDGGLAIRVETGLVQGLLLGDGFGLDLRLCRRIGLLGQDFDADACLLLLDGV